MNVTFVGAHQDDEMFCLGTLILCARRGDRLSLICTTNGDKGMSDDASIPHEEAARIRAAEMQRLADALPASYVCLELPDEALYDDWPTRLALIDALRAAQPDLVFTHFTADYNLDHTITSQLVFQTAMLAPIASIVTDHPPLAKSPAIFYVDPGPGYGFEATHFVAIPADVAEDMHRLMGFHASQQAVARRSSGRDYRDMIRERLTATGQRVGVPFAESFRPCLAARRTPLANMLP
jgi:LmbE family N-acetylglucosaminyl deacetylase